MAAAPNPERRFFGDARSFDSFGGNGSSSNASSLKANKPTVFAMPRLLGRRRWTQSGDFGGFDVRPRGGSKDKDSNAPAPKNLEEPFTSRTRELSVGAENIDARGQNKPETKKRPITRSKTILQLISTTFRSKSSPPGSSLPNRPRSPIQGASGFASKENREAALRERGLLPPLKPNTDLSRAEQERDRHLPVLPTPSNQEVAAMDGEALKVSAASKVKQEWEAKNKVSMDGQSPRERMNNFKFGGLAPSFVLKEDIPAMMSALLVPVEEVDTPLPPQDAALPPNLIVPETSSKQTSLESKRSLPTFGVEAGSHDHAAVQRPSIPSESHLVTLSLSPLPSSRLPPTTAHEHTEHYIPATSIALPPSPNSIRPSGLLSSQISPTISLLPPATFASSPMGQERGEVTLSSYDLLGPQPAKSKSESSQLTPSFGSVSQTTISSTFNTSEPELGTGPRPRPNALTVKPPENPIPIIIESPVEEFFLTASITTSTEVITTTDTLAADDAVSRPRLRNVTEPVGLHVSIADRPKSFNPFKRGQNLSPNLSSDFPPSTSRRLSMSASLSNIRRSFVGTLSRPKPLINADSKGFDASHLPPSPTISAAFAERGGKSHVSPTSPKWTLIAQGATAPPSSPELKPRQAVSPTLYSRGSILAEASNIEDEETRRMTELAFLG